jgi:hypothetical protein
MPKALSSRVLQVFQFHIDPVLMKRYYLRWKNRSSLHGTTGLSTSSRCKVNTKVRMVCEWPGFIDFVGTRRPHRYPNFSNASDMERFFLAKVCFTTCFESSLVAFFTPRLHRHIWSPIYFLFSNYYGPPWFVVCDGIGKTTYRSQIYMSSLQMQALN